MNRRAFLLGLGAAACTRVREPRAPAPSRVVIVGAGISGLAAAYELTKRGVDVLVLEATRRVGGRIRTSRSFGDGLYVEAGATHVVGDPDLLALMKELGVPLAERVKLPELAHVRYRHGERTVARDAPDEEEDVIGSKYLASSMDPRSFVWSGADARVDQMTAAAYLRSQGASERFIALAGDTAASGEGIESLSALFFLREIASIRREIAQGGGGRVAGGTDRIPEALRAKLGARVLLGAEVKRIEQTADRVIVVTADGASLEASRAILTMPFPVLRRIEAVWSPPKQRAIDRIAMTSVTRIYLGAKRRFWAERGESGDASTDLAIGDVRDETARQPGSAGVLGAYLSGEKARRFAAMKPEARVAAALEDAERVHPGLKAALTTGESVAWDAEPFARGAYAWFKPGELTELGPAAKAPEARVHFAGDGTSYRPGFMHGALSSVKRVVAEVLEAGR